MWVGLLASLPALAAPPSVEAWVSELGAPSKGIALTERVRSPEEPLLLYWMQVQADPLNVRVPLPGTLVANFTGDTRVLQDFTFLAVADSAQTAALLQAMREKRWLGSATTVQREGGTFVDHQVTLPDGYEGTISVRQAAPAGDMADGRPAPTLWMYVHAE